MWSREGRGSCSNELDYGTNKSCINSTASCLLTHSPPIDKLLLTLLIIIPRPLITCMSHCTFKGFFYLFFFTLFQTGNFLVITLCTGAIQAPRSQQQDVFACRSGVCICCLFKPQKAAASFDLVKHTGRSSPFVPAD